MRRLVMLLLVAAAAAGPLPAQDTTPTMRLHFVVDVTGGPSEPVPVSMTISGAPEKDFVVAIPVWAPGSYRLQNFYRNISGVAATAGGKEVKVEAFDSQFWRVKSGGAREVVVTYAVRIGRGAFTETWCDVIGPSTYFYVVDGKGAPCSVDFKRPEGWGVATGLEEKDGIYRERDYDTFIDCPSMVGVFDLLEFDELGTRYQLANVGPWPDQDELGMALKRDSLEITRVTSGGPAQKAGLEAGDVIRKAAGAAVSTIADVGMRIPKLHVEQKLELEVEADGKTRTVELVLPPRVDGKKMIDVHRKIVREHVNLYGGKAPFDRYVFVQYFKNQMGGAGLEHLNSCHIDFPYQAVKRDPATIASLNSHEFVHAWNVKRIRPFELGPFDYTKPVPSKHLWLSEGVTSYYGDLMLARSGIWDEERYFGHLEGEITAILQNPERKQRSIEDFSEKVWDKRTSFYYTFGEILGLLLDLRIRALTKNEKSLDDVMRHLYQTYVLDEAANGKGPIGVGFPRDGILKALHHVSGHDFKDFYDRHISGTEELPCKDVLGAAGLAFRDQGPDVGVALSSASVRRVTRNGPAEKAGVKSGDTILEVNGRKVGDSDARSALEELEPGKPAKLTVERDGKKLVLTVAVGTRPMVKIARVEKPTELQKKIVDGWLGKREY